ncbi:MAG: bacteriohemerythrin [Leptolyngbya sp.]|nr:bacteriohemerythrin [Leptolyngbya sp.]
MTTPIAQWKADYETGNTLVDQQHQGIFSIINALHSATVAGQGADLLESTIQSVRDYTTVHFDTEEQYMRDQNYAGYADHKRKHDALRAKFAAFETQSYPDIQQHTIMVSHFLTTWLIQHIQNDDQAMIAACRSSSQPVAAAPAVPHALAEIAQWRPEYETGYTLIDDQHRSLFHAINALHSAILEGRGDELLERTLKILDSYTTIHFETEERFMAELHYPDAADHCAKHRALRQKVEVFMTEEAQSSDRRLALRVSRFLTDWLIHHIRDEDQRMIAFLRQARQRQQALTTGSEPPQG